MKNIKQFFFIFLKYEVLVSIGVKFMDVILLVLFYDKNFIDVMCCFVGILFFIFIDGLLILFEKIVLKFKSFGSF